MKANFLAVILLIISTTSLATAATPYPSYYKGSYPGITPQQQASEPAVLLKRGIGELTAFIKSGQARDRSRALAFLKTEIAPYFDFAYMTRWAAGPAWNRMSAEQRARMQSKLTQSFIATLVKGLASYSDQPIRYFTPRGQHSNDVRVSAWIMEPSGIPTKLEFRFYRSKNGWKIFDVKVDGNSAVVHYRNQFRSMFSYNNPQNRTYR
jgi:phospholipid transport system substrate-binding protein